jgi:hypothetical protein
VTVDQEGKDTIEKDDASSDSLVDDTAQSHLQFENGWVHWETVSNRVRPHPRDDC